MGFRRDAYDTGCKLVRWYKGDPRDEYQIRSFFGQWELRCPLDIDRASIDDLALYIAFNDLPQSHSQLREWLIVGINFAQWAPEVNTLPQWDDWSEEDGHLTVQHFRIAFVTTYFQQSLNEAGLAPSDVDHLVKLFKACHGPEYDLYIDNLANELRYRAQDLDNRYPLSPLEKSKEKRKMGRPIRILILASNPKDTPQLRLDEEMRAIDQAVRQAEFRDKFDIRQQWAVRIGDLQGYLLRYKPDIVHFSGHGSNSSKIVLENEHGLSQIVPTRALSKLFAVLKDNIRCVILNACYSESQARAIAQNIDCVVGMSKAIGDTAAIRFSAAFYQALGYGRDIKTAFDLGCLQINMEDLGEEDTPKLLAVSNNPQKIVLVSIE